ncbi:PREDICTED: uncharacterized protein LOC109211065 [Nicotiana attenuata]|uniref:uncharacterized protein LOC109211065 n=1 Tax=Nicotiana attenuata TaxID=49451 RepID=UPI0009056FB6|nr:PREDICTED: uncharacterized protein LOC109211065 [Nicotiana attenuata]
MAPNVTNVDSTSSNSSVIIQFNPVLQLMIKLVGSHNFTTWKAQISMLMCGHNLFSHLDGSSPTPSTTITKNYRQPENPNDNIWFCQDQLIQNAIMASVDPTIAVIVAAASPAKLAWDSLHIAYANKSQTRVFNLRDQLARLSKDSPPVAKYLH